MEFKGTKGKWNYENGTYLENTMFFSFNNGEVIKVSNINYNDEATEETEANALLISKAPEMLEMIKLLIDRLEENDLKELSAVKRAKQLIKEATEL